MSKHYYPINKNFEEDTTETENAMPLEEFTRKLAFLKNIRKDINVMSQDIEVFSEKYKNLIEERNNLPFIEKLDYDIIFETEEYFRTIDSSTILTIIYSYNKSINNYVPKYEWNTSNIKNKEYIEKIATKKYKKDVFDFINSFNDDNIIIDGPNLTFKWGNLNIIVYINNLKK